MAELTDDSLVVYQRSVLPSRDPRGNGQAPRRRKGEAAQTCSLQQPLIVLCLPQYKPGYKRTYASGCRHGFGVRADLSDPKQKAGKENAFRDAVDWARTYL